MKKALTARLLPLVILASFGMTAAYSYTRLSPPRTWSSTPSIIVDNRGLSSVADGDLGRTRTRNAIVSSAAWNGAGCGTKVTATVGSVASFQLGDGIPMINFRDPIGACTGSCLAATFTGYYSQGPNGTYVINDADIVTNNARSWISAGEIGCSNEFYVESVMVHEVGHVLGLGHSSVAGATMNPSTVGVCNNSAATIEADDRAAICG